MKKTILFLVCLMAGFLTQAQPVKFKAKIENRNTDTIHISGRKPFRVSIPVNKSGVFEKSFDAPTGYYQFYDGVEYTMLYLKPGYDLSMTMDTKQFDESIVYTGKGAAENNFIAQKALLEEEHHNKMQGNESSDAWIAAINEHAKTLINRVNAPDIDAEFRVLAIEMINNDKEYALEDVNSMIATKKMIGNASPSFNYENHKGGKTKLEDLRGKYVYVDVWATWCGPCRQEIPHLQKVEQKYHGKKIEFVSMSIDEAKDHEKWQKFVTEKSLGGIQLFADNAWNSDFVKAFGIKGIPRFILIDPKGNVVSADAPRPSDPALQSQLDGLLK